MKLAKPNTCSLLNDYVSTPQNGQTRSSNSSETVDELFECV